MKALLILNFIIPFVMLLVGWMLKKSPRPYPGDRGMAKWKVDGSGYNTPLARTSRRHWDYAQAVAPEQFLRYGKLGLAAAVVCTLVGMYVPFQIALTLAYVSGFGCMIAAFVKTEGAIRQRFDG